MRFKRFANLRILKTINRQLLSRFLLVFEEELRSGKARVPAPDLPEDQYFQSLATMLRQPERLPDRLNEALFAIDEMANPEGQEALEDALTQAHPPIAFPPDATYADVALQVWLELPTVLAREHNLRRLRRLEAFEHFGAALPPPGRAPFTAPSPSDLESLAAGLDRWFAQHRRGEQTTRVEVYPIAGDFWFLVRHGDTFARRPTVERQRTEVIHYRPEKDDVVVYSSEHDELRINARSKAERQLYRRQFGLCLRGSEDYFAQHRTYTLEPLRADGPAALDPEGLDGIARITLREIEVTLGTYLNEVTITTADDIFRCGPGDSLDGPIPPYGQLARATFELQFGDSDVPRTVEVRLPNRLKLARHCDAPLVHRWLCRRGFRTRA